VSSHTRDAWTQGALLLAAILSIAIALLWHARRAFDRDTLAIQVGQLESASAEASLLAGNVAADRLAPSFVRQHAAQLAISVERTGDALRSKPSQPALSPALESARAQAAALHGMLQGWSRDAALGVRFAPRLDAMARQLHAMQSRLKPGQ
jgi:hypothetical protein